MGLHHCCRGCSDGGALAWWARHEGRRSEREEKWAAWAEAHPTFWMVVVIGDRKGGL